MNIRDVALTVCGIAIIMITYYGTKAVFLAIDEGRYEMADKLNTLIAVLTAILMFVALIIG